MTEFDLLTAVQPDEGWYAVVGIKDGSVRQVLVETREEVDEVADDFVRQRRNVFFGVAKYASDEGRTRRNVSGLKSLWVDVDCGPTKPYPDQVSGFRALKTFTQTIGLPIPIVVNSGRGLHVYWPLTETLTREEWEPLSDRLKALCATQEFHADPACFEAARILRIPGTYNFKDDPAPEVTIMHKGSGPIAPDALRKLLGVKHTPALPAPARTLPPSTMLSPMGQMIQNSTDKSFGKIVRRGTQGCAQILSCLQERETLAEPRWFNALSVAKFCRDKDKAIHKLSEGHPDYDPSRTEQKIAHIVGPHTCRQFDAQNPGVCQTCPHFGKIKSPIVLGLEVIPVPPEECEIVAEDAVGGGETTYRVPEYPFPYVRGKGGGVWRKGQVGKEGEVGEDVLVYPYDLYVIRRMTDPNDGAVVVLRHHTPRDGVEEFPVQVSKIMDGNELRKVLASKHIVTAKKNYDLLVDYVIRSIQQWVDSEKVEMMRTQFGWADGHSKFIIGDREISAEGTFYSPPSSATKALADHMRPTGSFEKWKEVFDLYGREGLEAHAFAAATAFGAPLLHISGQRGALINLAHSTSGAGKTTILHMCSSVWGDPVKLTSTSEDTHNSKVFKIGLFNSIPPCIDEMTNEDAKRVSELAYLITHGQGKDRMKASSNELRVNTTTWQTIALTTSNESFYDKLEALKRAPEGEMMRIIEIEIPHYDGVAIIDPEVGKAMFDIQLAQNYGFAGDIYAQYLVTHYEDVVDAYHEMQITIDREFKLTQRERFWSAVIAANLTGIRIAIRLGLCDWNLKRIYAYVRSLMQRLRTTTVAPPDDDRQLVGEFLNANMDSILIVKDSVDMRSNKVQFPTLEPKRELRVRYEPDTNTVYITAASFKRFCSMRSVNYRETLNKMKKSGMFIDSDLKRMAKGMKLNTPPVQALRFNASHSDFLALNTLLADKEVSTEAADGESP